MINRPIFLNQLINFKDKDFIKVITGIRRCGKSSLLKLFADYLKSENISDENIIQMNFESFEYDGFTYKELYNVIKDKSKQIKGKLYLLFDEIQRIKSWELAVNSLNKLDDSKPNMAFGNSDYYNENMQFIGYGEKNRQFSFLKSLFSCIGQGMTMTVNKKTRDMIIENMPKSCFFHDWWTYILCVSMGNVAYDNVTTVKYRRRKQNATSEGQGYFRLLMWRVKNLLFKNGMKDIKQQMINFKEIYYSELSEENKEILDLFSNEKYNFFRALKKAFYPKRIRASLLDDIMLRIIFIIGVL